MEKKQEKQGDRGGGGDACNYLDSLGKMKGQRREDFCVRGGALSRAPRVSLAERSFCAVSERAHRVLGMAGCLSFHLPVAHKPFEQGQFP